MTKHTPGPWKAFPDNGNLVRNVAGGGGTVAHVQGHPAKYQTVKDYHEIVEANARLIAAAPELLEALEELIDQCIHAEGSMDYNYGKFELERAEKAIAKAKGETK